MYPDIPMTVSSETIRDHLTFLEAILEKDLHYNQQEQHVCTIIMIGLLYQMVSPMAEILHQDDTDAEFMESVDAARSMVFAWITKSRTEKEMDRLQNLSCQCNVASNMIQVSQTTFPISLLNTVNFKENLHAIGLATYSMLSKFLADPIDRHMHIVLLMTIEPLVSIETEMRESAGTNIGPLPRLSNVQKRTRWPSSLRDLLPHGSEPTTRGLLRWMQIEKNPTVSIALHKATALLVSMCHPCIMPHIVTSRTFLVHGLIGCMTRIHTEFLRVQGNEIACADYAQGMVRDLATVVRIICSCFLHAMAPTQRRRFLSSIERGANDLLLTFVNAINAFDTTLRNPLLDEPSCTMIEHCQMELIALSVLIYEEFSDTRTHPGIAEETLDTLRLSAHRIYGNERVAAWRRCIDVFYKLSMRDRCCAPGCTSTPANTELRKCAGCLRMIYCSSRCQKIAWIYRSCPHREICKVIRWLCNNHHISKRAGRLMKWLENSEGLDLPESYRHSHDHAMAVALHRHFCSMNEAELKTPLYRSEEAWFTVSHGQEEVDQA